MYSVNVLRFIWKRYDPISERGNYTAALNDLDSRLKTRYEKSLDMAVIMQTLSEYEIIDYGSLYDVVMTTLYLKPPATHWAEKNQLLWREIPAFLGMMPNGKAILIIRDPRSVLLSFKHYTYAPAPAYLGAVFNCYDSMIHGTELQAKYGSEKILVIRYEDVARDSQRFAERVWKFLGLEGTYDVTDQSSWKDAYGRPWHANSSFHKNEDLRKFDVEASINRWKKGLNGAEIYLVEGVCGELMKEYDYELSGDSCDWLSAIRLFVEDDKVMDYFRQWLATGRGIEEFPTDPLNPANWRSD
jgi:hypothetical protein